MNCLYFLVISPKSDEAGLWLYTRPKHSDAWYAKLSESLDPGTIVKNFEEATSINDENLCLVLKTNHGFSPAFELKSVKCTEKKSVLCRTESKKNTTPKPSSFPCIPNIPDNGNKGTSTTLQRRKREVEGEICVEQYHLTLKFIFYLVLYFYEFFQICL